MKEQILRRVILQSKLTKFHAVIEMGYWNKNI